MKSWIRLIVMCLTAVLLIGGSIGYSYWDNLKQYIPLPVKEETVETLKELREELGGNPFKIAVWMDENIVGKRDEIQFAQTPEETFERRTGDCEDYAILSKYLLEVKYQEVHLILWEGRFTPESKSKGSAHHVISVFKIEGGWGLIDNNGLLMANGSLADAIRFDCKLRKIEVKRAFIARFFHYAHRKLKRII